MSFLLDTNVLSEWRKPHPDAGLVQWLRGAYEDELHISAVSIAEISYGVERLPRGKRRAELSDWLERDIVAQFGERVIEVDGPIATHWGRVAALRAAAGSPIAIMDAFVAATAIVRGFALVTRNEHEFRDLGLKIVNPWHH